MILMDMAPHVSDIMSSRPLCPFVVSRACEPARLEVGGVLEMPTDKAGYHGSGALNGGSPFPLYGPTKQALLSPALPTLECSMRSNIIESII